MLFQYSMPEWSLNGVNLDRWGFRYCAVDKDWFEDAMFQAVLGGEGDFVRGEVESDILTAEPGYP